MEAIRLTKADILKGKNNVHYVSFEALGGEIGISPLTAGQHAIVESIQSRGVEIKMDKIDRQAKDAKPDVKIDAEKVALSQAEANAYAVWYSLNNANPGDNWSLDEVKSLRPANVVEEIAKKVYEVSGVTPGGKDFIDSFR